MNKEKIQLIVIAAGIIIFIALAAGNLKKRPAKNLAQESKPLTESVVKPSALGAHSAQSTSVSTVDDKDLALQKEREKLDWDRDPFSASKAAGDYQRATLELKGISLGKNKNGFAFINNEIVKKGDRIGEYEVTEIQRDKVRLRKGEQSFYLTLPQE